MDIKNKIKKNAQRMGWLCFLGVVGFTSCSDDYTLDDSNPSWLGSSIYTYLENQGNYTNFVRLIDDLNYKEVLSRTGSRTLFVADDAAFNDFYNNNPWGVGSYDQLTLGQKKLLLNSAMVTNAYLLEMMSSTEAGSGDNDLPEKGQALRRYTAASVTDSVPHLFAEDLPISYNESDKDYWARFRTSDKGIYIALDNTAPMMTHFLAGQMAAKGITDADFQRITGQTRSKTDAYIYDSKVLQQDITCQNGYINRLDKVLLTPPNMAEVLRTNGRTRIFSHMIDRFSAPFYDADLTTSYRLLYGNAVDSVWQKRYFSKRSHGNSELLSDAGTDPTGNPTGNTVKYALTFDPGWNTYRASRETTELQDMGVIFCPTDEKLIQYFFSPDGGGHFLIKAYAPEMAATLNEDATDLEQVFRAIDQIPLDVIQNLLNNLMKNSFCACVPSKFETIKNSAQDPMFDDNDNYHRKKIVDVLMANNGIIYLMDEVTTPAQYAAVLAPTYTETDKHIFRYAIRDMKIGGAPLNYEAYLLAMSSRFSFFAPQDKNFWYIDPLSFHAPETEAGQNTLTGRAYLYSWDDTKNLPQLRSYKYIYDVLTHEGTLGEQMSTENIPADCYNNRLKDMLETHTIIHEDNTETLGINETETGVECSRHYFVTKNNAVIYVTDAEKRAKGMTVKGGWNLNGNTSIGGVAGDQATHNSTILSFDDKSAQTNGYGNGFAYMIDQPIIPTIESVYSVLYNNRDFSQFLQLCKTDDEVLQEIGITDNNQKQKYYIFTSANNGLPCYSFDRDEEGNFTGELKNVENATNVRFFNNYRYTLYVPTNTAIQKAHAAGLPTWDDVRHLLSLDKDIEDRPELTEEELERRNTQALAMVTAIVNFVKYHFQDNSIFADGPTLHTTTCETAYFDKSTNMYSKIHVKSAGHGTLTVTDATGTSVNITNGNKNLVARDYIISGTGKQATGKRITSSSSAVIHGIDGVLNYKPLANGRYDSDWATSAKARNYLRKHPVIK